MMLATRLILGARRIGEKKACSRWSVLKQLLMLVATWLYCSGRVPGCRVTGRGNE
jgi:hypothetical protein